VFTRYEEFYNRNKESYFKDVMVSLKEKAKELYEIQRTLVHGTTALSDFADYAIYNSERNVKLIMKININQTIDEILSLSEAMLFFITSAYNVPKLTLNDNLDSDKSFNYILKNGNEAILTAIDNASDFFSNVFITF